jgi:hypothetical protein
MPEERERESDVNGNSFTYTLSVSEVHAISCKSCDELEQFDSAAMLMTG